MLAEWIVLEKQSLSKNPRILWLFGTLVVAIPYSALTAGKVGGSPNSLLPALLPMAAFCALRLPRILKRVEHSASPAHRRVILGAFVSLLMLMTAFPHMTRTYNPLAAPPYWDKEYSRAISLARQLPGTVVCPEDPTIPFYARGYIGYNVYSENDTHLVNGVWPDLPTPAVLAEIRSADYVLDHCNFPEVGESLFLELGLEPVKDSPLDPKCYRLWRRKTERAVLRREPRHSGGPAERVDLRLSSTRGAGRAYNTGVVRASPPFPLLKSEGCFMTVALHHDVAVSPRIEQRLRRGELTATRSRNFESSSIGSIAICSNTVSSPTTATPAGFAKGRLPTPSLSTSSVSSRCSRINSWLLPCSA